MTKGGGEHYLSDLEGLRAVAIAAVLLFHINEHLLPGGFLGVDLFFVISGYIVTRVLVLRSESSSMLDFYIARFHRLIPAAAVTIFLTIVLFAVFADKLIDHDFFVSALTAALSVSNIKFLMTSGYWSDALAVNPFLHFWSLSVEEQFYLIWPATIYFFVIRKPRIASVSVTLLLCISVLMLYWIQHHIENGSFYLMPSRIFQFAAGALAYLLSSRMGMQRIREFAFVAGMFSFFVLLRVISGESVSILWKMIAPTLASFLILTGLQTRFSMATLSNKACRFIGKISYSLYLVHWPIVVLLKVNYGNGIEVQVISLLLSLFAGYLLYQNVENRYRLHKVKTGKNILVWPRQAAIVNMGVFLVSVSVISMGALLIRSEGVWDETVIPAGFRLADDSKRPVKAAMKTIWTCQTYEQGRLKGEEKSLLSTDLDMEQCLKGSVILIGDSWGPEAANVLFDVYGEANVAMLNSAGCAPRPNYSNNYYQDCTRINQLRFNDSLLSGYERVFIAANWNYWARSDFLSLVDFLKKMNVDAYLFSPRPNFTVPVPKIAEGRNLEEGAQIDLSPYEKKPSKQVDRSFIREVVSKYANINLIDWYSPLTDHGKLIAYTPEGDLIYRDSSHLSLKGMGYVSKELVKHPVWR